MKGKLPIIVLFLCVAAFMFGVMELFKWRFEAGDVYPAYSTLRFDPLGASAFYESLERIPGLEVSRDFRMTDQMPEGKGIAYLQLSGDRRQWDELPEDGFKSVDSFIRAGGRLVVALYPEAVKMRLHRIGEKSEDEEKADSKSKEGDGKSQRGNPKKKKMIGRSEDEKMVSIADKWGVSFDLKDLEGTNSDAYEPVTVANDSEVSLPATMDWHSGIVMTNLDKAWRVIYRRGSDAVLAERKMGKGTVVFSTDSYFLSNEAILKDRQTALLAWVVGNSRQVMFDEAHFGIVNEPGIAALMRNYHLQWLGMALLVLSGLFIWKNAAAFGPVRDAEETGTYVAGKDSAAGFINLLRHHIQGRKIIETCYAEWKKSAGKISSARVRRVEAFLQTESQSPAGRRDPVRAYRAICSLLEKNSAYQPEQEKR